MLALAATLGCLAYQDKTGPTYPLEGVLPTAGGPVSYKFPRSETIGRGLALVLRDPVPPGVGGSVRYRRYKSHDEWAGLTMERGEFELSRRGRTETMRGLGVVLPSLGERAGKYEFFVTVDDGSGATSVTGERPVVARYKGAVPMEVLALHILAVFLSMVLAIRTTVEALVNGRYRWMLWATIVSLLLGGFVLGPLVQWHAFGVWWSGVPFGFDWTDNKVLVELVFWVVALLANRGVRRSRRWVYLAGVATLLVYFVPHSIFGSEFDYRTGVGRGTAD
jgi:hypothetical protein